MGVAFWATVNDEVAETLSRGTAKLRPQDRKSGTNLWVVEIIAPFGGTDAMLKDLDARSRIQIRKCGQGRQKGWKHISPSTRKLCLVDVKPCGDRREAISGRVKGRTQAGAMRLSCVRRAFWRAGYFTLMFLLTLSLTFVVVEMLSNQMAVNAGAQQHTSEEAFFRKLGVIDVPPFVGMAWFPDNRRLAIAAGGIRIVDTIDGTVSPKLTKPVGFSLSISSDSRFLAALQNGRISVFSTKDWRELAVYTRSEIDQCAFSYATGFTFTPDSRSIWVGCSGRGLRGALKLSVPDLKVVDQVEVAPRWTSNTHVDQKQFIHVQPQLPVLHIVTWEFKPVATMAPGIAGPHRMYGRVVDLDNKRDILPTMEFDQYDWPAGVPANVYLSHDRRSYIASTSYHLPGRLVTFDVSTQKKIAEFGPANDSDTHPMNTPGAGWVLSNLLVLKSGRVIGVTHSSKAGEGALMLWDYNKGNRLDGIAGPLVMAPVAISQDETRIAVARDYRIYFYAID